ncbi:MAG: hypothetical protein WC602_02565, partial [archaeon]
RLLFHLLVLKPELPVLRSNFHHLPPYGGNFHAKREIPFRGCPSRALFHSQLKRLKRIRSYTKQFFLGKPFKARPFHCCYAKSERDRDNHSRLQ